MKIACIQLLTDGDINLNLKKIKKLIYKAIKKKADFIATPEVSSIFSFDKAYLKKELNDFQNDFFINEIKKIAKLKKKWILIGSVVTKIKKKLFNRSILINPSGKIVSYYDKIHMFDVKLKSGEKYFESHTFSPGKKIKVAKLPWGKLGMSICYDLRFPNMYRTMSKLGAIFLTVPSNFLNTTGKKHWHSLLKARAIENFSYVIAPAQHGLHENKVKVFGHSLIVSPDGKILKEIKKGEGVIVAKIDINLPFKLRNQIPSLKKD